MSEHDDGTQTVRALAIILIIVVIGCAVVRRVLG